jgi:predicted lipoprotein
VTAPSAAVRVQRVGPLRRRPLVTVAALAVLALLGWCFPPFHVVPLTRATERHGVAALDAAREARRLWESALLGGLDRAVDADVLLAALAQDAPAARERYGRVLGVSTSTLFFVRGQGRVIELEREAVVVGLERTTARIRLTTGPVFGNVVRDATGLIDISQYANSRDFNELATQLNRIVEAEVTPRLREPAAVGKTIAFVACAKLRADSPVDAPLAAVAVKVEWR